MGGNTLRITFKGATVFRVYWQVADFDVEDCKVEEFDRSAGWQTAMLSIVEQKDELIAASNKTKEDAIENKKSESIALGKLDNLKKKAESLGLKLDD